MVYSIFKTSLAAVASVEKERVMPSEAGFTIEIYITSFRIFPSQWLNPTKGKPRH